MKLLEEYKRIIAGLGLEVSTDGFLTNNGKTLLSKNLPVVLPTKENISTMIEVVDGKTQLTKTLFNPLKEDITRGDNASVNLIKNILTVQTAFAMAGIGEALLKVLADPDVQKKTDAYINKFLKAAGGALKGTSAKILSDEKTVKNWCKMYGDILENGISSESGLVHLYLKKKGVVNGLTYNRICNVSSPLVENLEKAETGAVFHTVKLNRKDLQLFAILTNFLLGDLEMPYAMGDNSDIAPGFVVLCKTYDLLSKRLNKLISKLDKIGYDVNDFKLNLDINDLNLDDLESFAADLATIPSDMENRGALARSKAANTIITPATSTTEVNRPTTYLDRLFNKQKTEPAVTTPTVTYAERAPLVQEPVARPGYGVFGAPQPFQHVATTNSIVTSKALFPKNNAGVTNTVNTNVAGNPVTVIPNYMRAAPTVQVPQSTGNPFLRQHQVGVGYQQPTLPTGAVINKNGIKPMTTVATPGYVPVMQHTAATQLGYPQPMFR